MKNSYSSITINVPKPKWLIMGKGPEQTFFQRRYKWPAGAWKIFSITNNQEMQIRTMRSYHLTPARMAVIKKITSVGEGVEKRTPVPCWWETQTGAATMVPQKIKTRTTMWSSNLMSIESVMPSNHLILCHPLLLLPSLFLSIWVFPESVFCIRWPKCWSFSFSISPSDFL